MKKLIDKYINQKSFLLILSISIVFFIIGLAIYISKTRIKISTKAANRCGNCTGSCNINGQYCEEFKYCDGQDPIIEVYICSNGRWEYAYPQRGAFCESFVNQCGGVTPEIPQPTGPTGCTGGLFNVIFRTNRPLVAGENITCTITGRSNCIPCTGAYRERSCGIGPGLSQCGVSGFDCTCVPFNYNCSGSAQASGTFNTVTNATSSIVDIQLPPTNTPPPPTNTPPPPTNTPRPPTNTPRPPTNTPPPPTNTPRPPTNTPRPTSTITNTPIPNSPTPTLIANLPTSTPTETPTPTEIILAKIVDTATPTTEIITTAPTIPSSGKIPNILLLIPLLIILLSLFI